MTLIYRFRKCLTITVRMKIYKWKSNALNRRIQRFCKSIFTKGLTLICWTLLRLLTQTMDSLHYGNKSCFKQSKSYFRTRWRLRKTQKWVSDQVVTCLFTMKKTSIQADWLNWPNWSIRIQMMNYLELRKIAFMDQKLMMTLKSLQWKWSLKIIKAVRRGWTYHKSTWALFLKTQPNPMMDKENQTETNH